MSVFNDVAVVVLAAGKGTRMKSDLAKVLHEVAGRSMVVHVVECATQICGKNVHVVIGHQAGKVRSELDRLFEVTYAVQTSLLGTGDAVKAAMPGIKTNINHILVLCGDVPLIQKDTLKYFIGRHIAAGNKATVLATSVSDPTGYGRILEDTGGNLTGIREEADANAAEKKIKKVNSGIYCFERQFLDFAIKRIVPDNNQKEYYLTDVISIAKENHHKVTAVSMDDPRQVIGVNTLDELKRAERLIQELDR